MAISSRRILRSSSRCNLSCPNPKQCLASSSCSIDQQCSCPTSCVPASKLSAFSVFASKLAASASISKSFCSTAIKASLSVLSRAHDASSTPWSASTGSLTGLEPSPARKLAGSADSISSLNVAWLVAYEVGALILRESIDWKGWLNGTKLLAFAALPRALRSLIILLRACRTVVLSIVFSGNRLQSPRLMDIKRSISASEYSWPGL